MSLGTTDPSAPAGYVLSLAGHDQGILGVIMYAFLQAKTLASLLLVLREMPSSCAAHLVAERSPQAFSCVIPASWREGVTSLTGSKK